MLKINLKDMAAVVTGGSNGLGKEICLKLAEAGANIVFGDINENGAEETAEAIRKLGVQAVFQKTDVTKEADVDALVAKSMEVFGKIDIMVNNAGVNISNVFMMTTAEDFERIIDVNLKGCYFGCKAAVNQMALTNEGVIINMASMAGKEGFSYTSLYSATKFGVIGMTQSIAREIGPMNLRINTVCPGIIRTAMWEKMLDEGAEVLKVPREEIWDEYIDKIPLGYPQEPEDIAHLVAFLCSDMASSITGQSISVNGGQVCF